MKKWQVGVVGAAVAGLTLAACNGTPSGPGDDGEISGTVTALFASSHQAMMDEVIERFRAEYPDVTIDITYSGEVQTVLSTQLQAGTAPDFFQVWPAGTPGDITAMTAVSLGSLGRLADLSDEPWSSEIPDSWLYAYEHENAIYGLPGGVQPLAAIYNVDVLGDLGLEIPTTLDEVYELCEAAQTGGIYAFSQGLGDVLVGPQMLSFAQTASLVYGPNREFSAQAAAGDVTYADSAWVDQFRIYAQMHERGCFGEGALGRNRQQGAEAVATGAAVAQVDTGGQFSIMREVAPDTNFVIGAIPATNDGQNFVTALPSVGLAVNAEADNPAAARAFLRFVAEPEQNSTYVAAYQAVPIIPNPQFTAPAHLEEFAALVADGQFAPLASFETNAQQVALNESVQSLLLGDLTPEQVAERIDQAADG